MGQTDGARLEKHNTGTGRRGNRGSTNNSARLSIFANRLNHGHADWGGCDPARIQSIVVGIGGLGGAATFGYSRDGGAHFLTLLLDDDRTTLWFNGDADLDTELNAVIERLAQLYDEEV